MDAAKTESGPKPKRKPHPWGITVDVEIDPHELHAEGWHHDSECDVIEPPEEPEPERMPFGEAVGSLHRQAHPSPASITLCHEEPCRSLSLDQLRQVPE